MTIRLQFNPSVRLTFHGATITADETSYEHRPQKVLNLLIESFSYNVYGVPSHIKRKWCEPTIRGLRSDWNAASAQVADGFTFTSPNDDDHIPVDLFKERCWGTAKFFKKVDYLLMAEHDHHL